MEKRGQTTYFLIIALIILIIFSITLFYKTTIEKSYQIQDITQNRFIIDYSNKLKAEISSCIEEINFIGLNLIGNKGGYLEIPNELSIFDTVYWYKEGVNFQPFLSEIENRLKIYLIDSLPSCIDRIVEKRRDFNLTFGSIDAKVKVTDNFILSSIDYPIILSTVGSSNFRLDKFEIKQKTAFWNLYEKATGIVNDASLPSFDACEPVKCSDENSNFVFF